MNTFRDFAEIFVLLGLGTAAFAAAIFILAAATQYVVFTFHDDGDDKKE